MIGATVAIFCLWAIVVFTSRASQYRTVEVALRQELDKRKLTTAPSEDKIKTAAASIWKGTDRTTTNQVIGEILLEGQQLDLSGTDDEKFAAAERFTQARTNTSKQKSSGTLLKEMVNHRALYYGTFAMIILLLGIILYVAFATSVPYYAYFLGAVAIMLPLLLCNFWNVMFFVPLFLCLALMGLFIGLGAREVILANTLETGQRPS